MKKHEIWQLYFSPKVPKEKFDTLCNDSIDKTEIKKVFYMILTILYRHSSLLSEKFILIQ